jgi:hypothetical protein
MLNQSEVIKETSLLVGETCWGVSAGAVGSTFFLNFGEKRIIPARGRFSEFELGEMSLGVWCTWRLDNATSSIMSSDEDSENVDKALRVLKGLKVVEIKITMPAWDLLVLFENELTLHVFCDQITENSSSSTNWEFWNGDKVIGVERNNKIEIEISRII